MQRILSYPLDDADDAVSGDVGGKAISLIKLTSAGFPVPRGTVLCSDFFAPWLADITSSESWRQLLDRLNVDNAQALQKLDSAIAAQAGQLEYDDTRINIIRALEIEFAGKKLAVRSSSPEEDLEGASFAGLYETSLNVSPESLESAVRQCFMSCLNSRVLVYKQQMGLQDLTPRIAVVIQEQCDSEVSGVAFSLNPVNNDFDEMMVNASWGLGEALVSGELTPDSYVVSKPDDRVLDVTPGSKGGDRSDQQCLSRAQLSELTTAVCAVETQYGEPVDVEWAFAGGALFLLQARPVTTYIPLPESLQTEPGERRILYMDPALADGLTLSGPIPRMTLDFLEELIRQLMRYVFGIEKLDLDPKSGVMGIGGARFYINVSNILHLWDPKRMAELRRMLDNTLADIFLMIDKDQYQAVRPPIYLKRWRVFTALPRLIFKMWPFLRGCTRALTKRQAFDAEYNVALIRFEQQLTAIDPSLPLAEFNEAIWSLMAVVSARVTAPALVIFVYGRERIKAIAGKSEARLRLVDQILAGSDDLVHQMGLEIYSLSTLLPVEAFADIDQLTDRLATRDLPAEFLNPWDDFIARFGCRGALEMDLARARYADDPAIALRQIGMMATGSGDFDPREVHLTQKQARQRGYEQLLEELGPRKQRQLKRAYQNMTRYEPAREMPKHHMVMVNHQFRKRLLAEAQRLVAAGRLDAPDDVFELGMADLIRASREPGYDLRAVIRDCDPAYRHGMQHVRHFPHTIDSRGRILRPVKPAVPGQLQGMGVSPGIVTGTVKVLYDPYEKTIEPGDILVAYTTDPGWTPLFVNAAAVLLEVGGQLQHGALVAREYGKPCVAGILDVTKDLKDGQQVEVDGSAGIVRLIEPRA